MISARYLEPPGDLTGLEKTTIFRSPFRGLREKVCLTTLPTRGGIYPRRQRFMCDPLTPPSWGGYTLLYDV